jgi:hypothetical protein
MPKAKKKSFRSNKFQEDRSGVLPPPIEFTPSTWFKKEDDEGVMSFKLRSNPTEKNSPQYEMQAKIFATGSVEQYIWWKRDLYKVITGQNITRAQDKFTMARRLLHGDALAAFENFAMNKDETKNEDFEATMRELAKHIFPKNALANQKAWLRCSKRARKDNETLTRRWVARIQEINMMLPEFPPDFDDTQKMRSEDVLEVLEYGIPQKWKAKMVETGFVPADHQPTEFVEFCERMESSEQMLGLNVNKTAQKQEQKGSKPKDEPEGADRNNSNSSKTSVKTPKARNTPQKRCKSFVESGGTDGCGYHINTTTHRSNECKVLMAQAASMRGQAEAAFKGGNKKNGNQKKSGGDFHALMAQADSVIKKLAKGIKKRKPKANKKRKRDESDSDDESSKNFDSDNFHLDLEENSLKGGDSVADLSELDWGSDNGDNGKDE